MYARSLNFMQQSNLHNLSRISAGALDRSVIPTIEDVNRAIQIVRKDGDEQAVRSIQLL
jgi:hypothetical protein